MSFDHIDNGKKPSPVTTDHQNNEYRRIRMSSHNKSISTDSESDADDSNELPNRKVNSYFTSLCTCS